MEQILIRENCIGIKYNRGLIKQFHFDLILHEILGIPDEEVEGIDDRGNDRWIFQVTSKERYDAVCEKFTGRDIPVGNDCCIQVDDISSPGTRIEISCVPFSISNQQLSGMLSKYGEIYKCQNYNRTFGKYNKLKRTSDRIFWMKLNDQMPQMLIIKDTEISSLYVKYQKQPLSCNKCGHAGHKSFRCNRHPDGFKNIIDINDGCVESDFSDNIDMEDVFQDDDDISNISVTTIPVNLDHIDVHIDPSQNQNNFKCKNCDYQCSYEHILKIHMESHTGEKPHKCSDCEYQSNDAQTLKDHMKTHLKEKPSDAEINNLVSASRSEHVIKESEINNGIVNKCTECSFNCKTLDEILNHLITHNIYACNKCDYRSNSSNGLKGHIKKHNEKKFKCTKCDFKATSLIAVSNHMKIHTGEEICISPVDDEIKSSQSSKRGLPLSSPEKIDLENSTRRNSVKNIRN